MMTKDHKRNKNWRLGGLLFCAGWILSNNPLPCDGSSARLLHRELLLHTATASDATYEEDNEHNGGCISYLQLLPVVSGEHSNAAIYTLTGTLTTVCGH